MFIFIIIFIFIFTFSVFWRRRYLERQKLSNSGKLNYFYSIIIWFNDFWIADKYDGNFGYSAKLIRRKKLENPGIDCKFSFACFWVSKIRENNKPLCAKTLKFGSDFRSSSYILTFIPKINGYILLQWKETRLGNRNLWKSVKRNFPFHELFYRNRLKNKIVRKKFHKILFYFIWFYSIKFNFILLYYILFYFILFYMLSLIGLYWTADPDSINSSEERHNRSSLISLHFL